MMMPVIDIPGGQLHYTVAGSGGPLCVTHQYGAVSVSSPLVKPLHPSFTCYAINGRGIGDSGPVRDERDLTMTALADDLEAVRQALRLDSWVLMGHSTGGMVMLIYATKYPQSVRGLILIGTAASHRFITGSIYDPHSPHAAELAAANREMMSGTPEGMTSFAQTIWSLSVADPSRTMLPHANFFGGQSTQRSLAFVRELPQYDLEDKLAQIRVPTLVMVGRYDPQCPVENSERLAAALPDAELVIFEQSGHFPFIEEPQSYREALRLFVEKHSF
jgi:proline iminopeptidase